MLGLLKRERTPRGWMVVLKGLRLQLLSLKKNLLKKTCLWLKKPLRLKSQKQKGRRLKRKLRSLLLILLL